MHIENIRCIEEKLAECIKSEFDRGIESINTEEMGQVTDMLKDVAEAEYYARIGVAMQEAEAEDDGRRYYDHYRYKNGRFAPKGRGTRRGYEEYPYYHMTPEMYREYERDMDRDQYGRMYYTETEDMRSSNRDRREGRSGISRRTYMESKAIHSANTKEDNAAKMRDLEKYLDELGEDLKEMIMDASPEEKTVLKQKLSMLVQRMQ